MTYKDLMDAIKLIAERKRDVGADDGPCVISPAWRMLHHAQDRLLQQAEEIIRQ